MILLFLLVTATFRPAAPTVGDPITVQFEQPVVLDPSNAYEVVSHDGETVVLRTFRPEPFELSGRTGEVFFRKLIVPVTSVLEVDDPMEPAPLKPPLSLPRSRRPWIALGSAAVVAALAWLAVILLFRQAGRSVLEVPPLPAAERYRRTIEELRRDRARTDRWAALADATRHFLVSIEPTLGLELTTAEFLQAAGETNVDPRKAIPTILRQGDLEKFSPWGANAHDFDAVAVEALGLIPTPAVEEVAA